jgi:hypothetical protein
VQRKFTFWKSKISYLLFFLLLIPYVFLSPQNLCARFDYDRIEYFRVLERAEDSLEITKYRKFADPKDRRFVPSYWKVYYQDGKIVGEELYVKMNLEYYYIYYHTPEKIYQKGFYWNGIYREIKYFKAHGKYIKQGWIYKNYPETYRVYDKEGKLIYKHNFEKLGY